MSDLSPELQKLVQAEKLAGRPRPADFERVYAALEQRIGSLGPNGSEIQAATAKGAIAQILGKAAMVVVGVALLGGAFAISTSRVPRAEPLSHLDAAHHEKRLGPVLDALKSVASMRSAARDSSPRDTADPAKNTQAPARNRDRLSEEVAILYRAETELHAGRAANALRLLQEHERRFSRGVLAEERTAARIQALCALGRGAEANALVARLNPGSLHGERTRDTCRSAPKAQPR